MARQARQLAIKEIISHHNIGTQEELCKTLKKSGFDVTQATLSRDLKEMGISRGNSPVGMKYELHPQAEEERLKPFLGMEIETIEANESIIVVRTLPGRAQGVAQIIDSYRHPSILGTLAGDDTILIVPISVKKIKEIVRILRGWMEGTKKVA